MVDGTVREAVDGDRRSTEANARSTDVLFLMLAGQALQQGCARFDLTGVSEVRIGRGPNNGASFDANVLTLELSDKQVSGKHLRLVRTNSAFRMEDLGSTNGTFTLAGRFVDGDLNHGETFVVGSAAFVLYRNTLTTDAPRTVMWGHTLPESTAGMLSMVPTHAFALSALARIARADISVLLRGESGTGKEVIARAVHTLSARSEGPFVAVNCAALPESLVESQLFGHAKGAFSGAVRDELGYFRAADGGTLFLDEIGDMKPAAQAALLRALETREITPVGSTKAVPVNIRLVSATLRDESTLRPDLLARIAGYRHVIPPLRERMPDLGLLLADHAKRLGHENLRFAPEAVRVLAHHTFPLNVRELTSALKSAAVLAAETGGAIMERHLSLFQPKDTHKENTEAPAIRVSPKREPVSESARRADLLKHLTETAANVSEVARRMNTTRAQVHRWCQKFEIDLNSFRQP